MTDQTLAETPTIVHEFVSAAGDTLNVLFFYGSHLHGAGPAADSAIDFVAVVSSYRAFYRRMHRVTRLHRPPWLLSTVARILPPNSCAFASRTGAGLAKCQIITCEDMTAALGPRRKDHLLVARFVQPVEIVWKRDQAMAEWAESQLAQVRGGVLEWVGPFLDTPFDAESVARRMLEVSYAAELRPEPHRAGEIFERQRAYLVPRIERLLAASLAAGLIRPAHHGYEFVVSPSPWRRRALRWYFARSNARITARWLKHVITFDGWLTYIARKVERRTGQPVHLSRLEQRLPLIFLWPRAIRVLRGGAHRGGQQ